MIVTQLAFPFRHNATTRLTKEFDFKRLVGFSYIEGKYVTATVIGVCENNIQVLVRRRPGGTVWLPGWLVRMILLEEKGPNASFARARDTIPMFSHSMFLRVDKKRAHERATLRAEKPVARVNGRC